MCAFLFGCKNIPTFNITAPTQASLPQKGGTLKIYSYNPDTLNPIYTYNKANEQMLRLVFESLIECDEEQKPVCNLAESYTVSQNGLVWNIITKSNVLWHDGTLFSAYDAASTFSNILNNYFSSIYSQNLSNVRSVKAKSPNELEITLNAPQTNFINLLDVPIIKEAKNPEKDNFSPIGTGAYVYNSTANKSIYLTANNNWWRNGSPYISNIEVKLMPDKNTSVFAFDSKEIDLVTTDIQNWGKYPGNFENKTIEYSSGNFNFINFNLNNKYLSNQQIRKAIAYCINKKRIFDEVLLSHGAMADTFIHQKWWMYNDQTSKYVFDTKYASELLEGENIKPNSITLDMLVVEDNNIKSAVANIIKQGLKEAKIDVIIKYVDWEQYKMLIANGNYDMYLGEINYSQEVNPEYAILNREGYLDLFKELQLQIDDGGRKKVYNELQAKYAEELPSIPLYFDASALIFNNNIEGNIKPNRTNMFSNIGEWFLNKF